VTREHSPGYVTKEQRSIGPKLGLPEGLGPFLAASASLILYILQYAHSSLLVSLKNCLRPITHVILGQTLKSSNFL